MCEDHLRKITCVPKMYFEIKKYINDTIRRQFMEGYLTNTLPLKHCLPGQVL